MRGATVHDDLPWTPLCELSCRLATGATSSFEIVEACLARIDALDGKLHAYVEVYRDDAIAGAKAADLQRRAGLARGPLHGLPIALKLTPGQAHDGRSAADMLDTLGGGDVLLADRAYDSDALRLEMAARGAWANIKPMPGRKRRPPFSAFLYRYRNLVERFFSKLKHFRAVATRFEKHSENYLALVKLASAKIWMRFTSW